MSGSDWPDGRILVLGAGGMLGHELVDRFRRRFASEAGERVLAWDLPELDIRNRGAVIDAIGRLKPSVVVNAAALTDVDGCETDIEPAMAVNGRGPGHLAATCAENGVKLVHFGTDFIFDGKANRPYRPDDAANPLSIYGLSKWEGEQAVRATSCKHLIVRTSWLFGPGGRNFVEAILSRAKAGYPLSVVTDQVGSPTLAGDLAEAVVRLLDAGAEGTVHFANSGQCSWFEFAQEIVRQAGLATTVQTITSDQLSRAAKRPRYSVLDTETYTELADHRPRPWQDALKAYLEARRAQPEATTGLSAESAVSNRQKQV